MSGTIFSVCSISVISALSGALKQCRKGYRKEQEKNKHRDPVHRDSQLKIGWTEEKCIAIDKLAQEDHSYCPSSGEYERYRKNWYISLNKSDRNTPMKLRSDFRTAVTSMHRLHRESGEERPEPIPFHQYQRWHSPSSSSTSWWQWNDNWWSSIFYTKFVVATSITADGNLLQPTGRCEQNTLTCHIFLCLSALMIMSHTTLAQGFNARHTIHVSCACVRLISLRPSLRTLHLSLPSSTSSS